MSFRCYYFGVMKGEKKKTFTYATYPSKREKATVYAEKEGLTLSEKIDQLIGDYILDNISIKESNKKKK